jgi:hypothetical protein
VKKYKLKVPVSSISLKDREKNYFDWRWIFFEDLVSRFVEGIRRKLDLSYGDYQEDRETDEYYSFGFRKNSVDYVVSFIWRQDTKEFVEFEMNCDVFEVKKILFFSRKFRSEQPYKKFKEIILEPIKLNNFEISDI